MCARAWLTRNSRYLSRNAPQSFGPHLDGHQGSRLCGVADYYQRSRFHQRGHRLCIGHSFQPQAPSPCCCLQGRQTRPLHQWATSPCARPRSPRRPRVDSCVNESSGPTVPWFSRTDVNATRAFCPPAPIGRLRRADMCGSELSARTALSSTARYGIVIDRDESLLSEASKQVLRDSRHRSMQR